MKVFADRHISLHDMATLPLLPLMRLFIHAYAQPLSPLVMAAHRPKGNAIQCSAHHSLAYHRTHI